MLGSDYAAQNCSVARALELVGERWTILILRDVFLGKCRFEELQGDLGIARNILQARLERLVEEGILRRVLYQERPPRYEYRLSRKGTDLWPVLVALLKWGDQHAAAHGPPVVIVHKGCGGEIDDRRRCLRCGSDLEAWQAIARPGRGSVSGTRAAAR